MENFANVVYTLHENLICLIDCLRILLDSENLKEYLYGLLGHASALYIVISNRIDDVDISSGHIGFRETQ